MQHPRDASGFKAYMYFSSDTWYNIIYLVQNTFVSILDGFNAAFDIQLKAVEQQTVNRKARPVLRALLLLIRFAMVATLCLVTIKEKMNKSE